MIEKPTRLASSLGMGSRSTRAELLRQLAKGLHVSAQALYAQAGLIEGRESRSDVLAAIQADITITERQRQMLIDIYTSFRNQGAVSSYC
ncbi:hypothetical protein GCM10010404_78420 [Nonomuraea africana]|uniref:Uncharacterized protein n=1 Tax=Nonomuraea africana TaxID=46171 RepID=A0ABR9KIT0_9ACTN|nr:hypothetical protein [Nonomuraea africana]MBE1561936.1 hypothetical protein [Nonomuraea africana]